MNLFNIFNFIKEKRGYDYPFIYKLLNGLQLTFNAIQIVPYEQASEYKVGSFKILDIGI